MADLLSQLNPQTAGSLPLENTGVPNSVQSDQQPDSEQQATNPQSAPVRTAANPNQVPALIAALSGLSLNIGGALSGRGAVGNDVLDTSQSLIQQGRQKLADQYQASQSQFKMQRAQDEAKALAPSLDDFKNPAFRARAEQALRYGDTQGFQQAYKDDLSQQRADRANDNYGNALLRWGVGQEEKATGQMVQSAKEAANAVKGSLDPSVGRAVEIQNVLTQLKQVPQNPTDLKLLFNSKSTGIKLTDKDAKELLSNDILPMAQQAAPNRTVVGVPIPGTSDVSQVKPADVFANYAASKFDPTAIAAYQQKQQQVSDYSNHAAQLEVLREALGNPITRPQAQQQLANMHQTAMKAAVAKQFVDSASQAQNPAQAGAQGAAPSQAAPQRIQIQDSRGNRFTVPASQVGAAQQQGYKLVH